MYRIYIRTFDGTLNERTTSDNLSTALATFAGFVNDTTRDGTKTVAVLAYCSYSLFMHRFDSADCVSDSFRGRLPTPEQVIDAQIAVICA